MIVIILHEDGTIEAMGEAANLTTHIVVINEAERWTDSPAGTMVASEDEMAEQVAAYRNAGYEDRNP